MQPIIEQIHNSPLRCVLITAGAGTSAVSALTSVAGCSRTLVDAQVPYSAAASRGLLDNFPYRHLCSEVSLELAQHAYHRAQRLLAVDGLQQGANVVGIGCTAAIQTDRARKGEDAGFVTCWHAAGVDNYHISFSKSLSREEQEKSVSALIIYALAKTERDLLFPSQFQDLAECLGIPTPVQGQMPRSTSTLIASSQDMNTVIKTESFSSSSFEAHDIQITHESLSHSLDPIVALLRGQVNKVIFNQFGIPRHAALPHTEESISPEKAIYLLFPGSFSPLHFGHLELARIATKVARRRELGLGSNTPSPATSPRTDPLQPPNSFPSKSLILRDSRGVSLPLSTKPVIITYELSACLVGKRDLHQSDLAARVKEFSEGHHRVAVTRAKLFVEKARMFPNHGFIVGIETAERVLDIKHYGNDLSQMTGALDIIRQHNCYFLVGGRIREGVWRDLTSLQIPDDYDSMFVAIPKEEFRVDISSTEIRARRGDVKEMKLYVDVERIYNELRELGIGPTDPVALEQLLPFDQYHYFGTDTVDEGVQQAGIGQGALVLDVGAGLGGPARYMAHKYHCQVTAVELQADVSRVGEDLTQRSGLTGMVLHRASDFMSPEQEHYLADKDHYDAVVSWLTFVHIPDRKNLLRRCFSALKPGGKLFVEDFHLIGKDFTADEWKFLNEDVHCSYLPTLAEFRQQLQAAGFIDINLVDYTSQAVSFAKDRHEAYANKIERHIRVHGKETAEGMLHFYKVIDTLFQNGHFGLCRVLATKPTTK